MSAKPFFDTNVVVYAFRAEEQDPRCEVARILLATGGLISVQGLNELVAVLRRKVKFSWEEVSDALRAIRSLFPSIAPLTSDTHEAAVRIAQRYQYHIYDSLIIAAALEGRCKTLYSEDMHDGQVIDGLTIRNPFTKSPGC